MTANDHNTQTEKTLSQADAMINQKDVLVDTSTPSGEVKPAKAETTKPKPRRAHWLALIEKLADAGKPVPKLFADALDGGPAKALAIGSHDDLVVFMNENDYSTEETATMQIAVSIYTRVAAYQHALAAEGATRFTIHGELSAPVSPEDRMTAQLTLLSMSVSDATRQLGIAVDKLSAIAKELKSGAAPANGKPSAPERAATAVQAETERLGGALQRTTLTIEGLMERRAAAKAAK